MIDHQQDLPASQGTRDPPGAASITGPGVVATADLTLMRRIDELHLEYPFAGSRMLRDLLAGEGITVGRLHVATLMKRMSIESLYRPPFLRPFIPAGGMKGLTLAAIRSRRSGRHCRPAVLVIVGAGIFRTDPRDFQFESVLAHFEVAAVQFRPGLD